MTKRGKKAERNIKLKKKKNRGYGDNEATNISNKLDCKGMLAAAVLQKGQ